MKKKFFKSSNADAGASSDNKPSEKLLINDDGRARIVIEGVVPEIDAGRFAIKRIKNDWVTVEADIFCDGHDRPFGAVRYRQKGASQWQEQPFQALVNDRWRASFQVKELGRYEYTLVAWVDHFLTWRHDFERRLDPDDVALALREGAQLITAALARVNDSAADKRQLSDRAQALTDTDTPLDIRRRLGLAADLHELMLRYPDRRLAVSYDKVLEVIVDDERARFSSWYELFPRSCAAEPGQHGTFNDVIKRLPAIADMGFNVVYLPPVHPIGRINRKGPNNALTAGPADPGVPWAIGAKEGGHKAIHPELGTPEDFRALIKAGAEHGIDIALDIALQCAPDHPYVTQYPQWFKWRPDNTVQYAENPPKKYQDIFPFNFETDDWQALWLEIKSIFEHWIAQGVRIFRVDNPHTKPFAMWEWLIAEIKRERPDAIFLSEAFTRPKVMHRLAKLGFTQSYTYFTWRNSKAELTDYLIELTDPKRGSEYFRPNFWPNTPDILHEFLQQGGPPASALRLILATTLTANYGIYGPAFERVEVTPREPGSEEYLDSEKYQIRYRSSDQPALLSQLIGKMNAIRNAYPALQRNSGLRFHGIDNDQLLCYSKSAAGETTILVVVNLDYTWPQSGWTTLDLSILGVDPSQPFQVVDVLNNTEYVWEGAHNFVALNPHNSPAHVFEIRQNNT